MWFSDTTSKTGLVEDIDFLLGTDSTSYPLVDKARNINRWYYKAVTWIWGASRRWEFDDSNHTTHPEATTDLVASQQDYSLPTNALKVLGVSVKNSAGDYYKLRPINAADLSIDRSEFEETDGLPLYYDLVGENIFLYPAPASGSVTLTAGLKVYFLREVDVFVSTDTSQEPGIAEPFQRILSLGAAYDYALKQEMDKKANILRAEIEQLKRELEAFYGDRNLEEEPKLEPKSFSNTQHYL